MTADGVWTYKLDDANCAVQALNVGDTLTDTFTVTTIDGTEQVVTITIHGANDADPNDFDYLATGRHIVSDPPHIFGTRGDDTIDGLRPPRSNLFARRRRRHHQRRPANVTSSTQAPAMTRSRAMTGTTRSTGAREGIRSTAGDGCDTIVGGYGADNLTGGKGNDSFVFLSAADSNAAHFDVITDFKSGSDRIDLTALGALCLSGADVREHIRTGAYGRLAL